MDVLKGILDALPDFLPLLVTVAATLGVLAGVNWALRRRAHARGENTVAGQVLMLVLTGAGIIAIVLALPVSETTRGQLLTLLGVALMAIITLSSTTFAANAMAGLMLRAVRSFRPGDFVRVGDAFGRVTERGLFHTEIQTEDRDLTTLPNLYLVQNPITVVRSSGTIVSSTVSLGYDVPRARLEPLLVQAAEAAELAEPFVQVTRLGDFSVNYRVAGFLPEVTHLLTTRSTLRKKIMDTLHEAGIEIVSPNYMNQRVLAPGTRMIPAGARPPEPRAAETPEAIIFDKAEQAQHLEELRKEQDRLASEIKDLKGRVETADKADRAGLEQELADRRAEAAAIDEQLAAAAAEPPPE